MHSCVNSECTRKRIKRLTKWNAFGYHGYMPAASSRTRIKTSSDSHTPCRLEPTQDHASPLLILAKLIRGDSNLEFPVLDELLGIAADLPTRARSVEDGVVRLG